MVKNYIAEARMAPSKLKKLINGGAITIKPADIANSANSFVKLQFGKLKDLNRYKRNITNNKGFRVNKSMLNDMVDGVSGGSLFTKALDKLKDVGQKMGKPFEKTVQVNPFTAGYDLGHNVIAPALMKNGINFVPKKLRGGKLPKVKIDEKTKRTFKQIGKAFVKEAKKVVKDNKDELKMIARNVADTAINSANGEASGKDFGRSLVKGLKDTSHLVAKSELTKAGIYNNDNPYQYGQYKPQEVIEGSGLDNGLGGRRLVNNPRLNPASRMAYARSFRKSGGSFRPLG